MCLWRRPVWRVGFPTGPFITQSGGTLRNLGASHNRCRIGWGRGRRGARALFVPLYALSPRRQRQRQADVVCFQPQKLFQSTETISGGKASWIWSAVISELAECDNWLLNPLCNAADGWCACVCMCVNICMDVCTEDSNWARIIAATQDLQKSRCFPKYVWMI